MTPIVAASRRRLTRLAAACGLLVLSLHLFHGDAPRANADEGIVRLGSLSSDFYARENCATNDAAALNLDHSYGYGRGRIPFDRWYYLRRAFGYTRIYPADVNYVDPRDRRVFSAQGYGVPVAVPLSANVEFQYNYSHGPQGSRLTPVSRPGR